MMAKENHGSTCEKACGERKEVWRKSIGRRPSLTFSSPRNIRQLSLCACVCVLCYWSWERSGSIFILFFSLLTSLLWMHNQRPTIYKRLLFLLSFLFFCSVVLHCGFQPLANSMKIEKRITRRWERVGRRSTDWIAFGSHQESKKSERKGGVSVFV